MVASAQAEILAIWRISRHVGQGRDRGRSDRPRRSEGKVCGVDKISREVSGARLTYEPLDLASLASIADFAQRVQSRQSSLINNAGVVASPADKPRRTAWRCNLEQTI